MTAPYEDRDGWEMNVMYLNGTMFFEEHLTSAKLDEKNNMNVRQRTQTYYGYAFESYCTSETPTRPPGWGGDVDTNVQWCSVVRTKLGDLRMVLGGEVDCIKRGTSDTLVELKTSLVIRNAIDEAKFEKKLLKFYFQSFLLGVPEIVVGFRTPPGEVKTLQTFKTIEIPRLVRGKPNAWDPSVCLSWGAQFLTFLKEVVRDRQSEKRTVWRVKFVPREGVTVRELDSDGVAEVVDGESRVGFLPEWFFESSSQ